MFEMPGFLFSQGHDVIAQAQSGTGKTATFAISVLESLDVNDKACQSLILAPTRELAQQIQKVPSFPAVGLWWGREREGGNWGEQGS